MKSLSLAAVLTIALGTATLAADMPAYITSAVADATRPQADRDADALRDPAATLAFAGIRPGMVVGELYPCGGYFSRTIADAVGPSGKVYGLDTSRWKGCAAATQKVIDEGHKNFSFTVNAFGEFTLPEKVDLFWITQNYHDLHIAEYGAVDMAVFNKRVFDALKPGGTYFILDHQANAGMAPADMAKLHRIEKSQVIAEVIAAGFKLVAEGDALHRADDDHSKPIFDLHGKTDQYMLKFIKP